MSEKNMKERVLDQSAKDKKDIEDWMFGSGGKILGAIVVLLGIWTVVRLFWS
ncbi:hypothetical protein IV500_05180 [Paeniglutamicibacter antarcticus]|uniref:Uncharacterized protein n=1 Tax=Arthrobacter terrae TaxID=2935737 RepID=A0A931CKU9_9MICC|nr:hypothetical protein [Arthrobacter terrae]MBG0738812.1 hypothetical protein [Arthrobacter terrae]